MFLMALWASFYHPIANSLISKIFVENTAGAMGIHGAVGSMGQIFTPTIAYLLGTLIGWRLAFVFFGLLTMATALAMRGTQVSEDTKAEEAAPLLGILRVPNLWILLLFNVIVGLFFRGIELFFPTFLRVNRGFSGQLAAISNSLILLFGVLGQLLGGRMADAYGSAKVILISSLGVLGSLIMLLMLPLNITGVILFITLYGSFYFSHQPAMTSLVSVVSPKNLTGMAYGVMFFFSFGLGSFSTTIVGYLADAFNLEIAFWVMTLLSTIALIVSLIIMTKLKK
jgi:predicted MFS family arabinose efflux permease